MREHRHEARPSTLVVTLAPLVAVAAAVVVTRWALQSGSLIDTVVFRTAAHAVLRGQSPYFLRTEVPFVYPPAGIFAALLAVAGPNVHVAATLWAVVSLAALARTTWILVGLAWPALDRRGAGQRTCWLFAVACVLEPTRIALSFGQVGLLLLWLTVEGLRGQPAAAGRTWLVGVAAAMKLTPTVVLVGLAAAGRWRSAMWGVAGFVAACAAAAAVAPVAARDYVGGAWRLAHDVNSTPDVLNHSLNGVSTVVGLPSWMGLTLATLGLVAGITVTALLWRRHDELGGLSTVLVTGLLVSPVSWVHHWVAAFPALVLLLRGISTRRGGARVLLATALVGMVAGTDALALHGGGLLDPGGIWSTALQEWYVVWGLALVCWAGSPVVRNRSAPAPATVVVPRATAHRHEPAP
ncbi:MAG TPA: glycosyltransferase 87 family protein [Candidatus Nanopelagicales bacterium]